MGLTLLSSDIQLNEQKKQDTRCGCQAGKDEDVYADSSAHGFFSRVTGKKN